MKSKRVLVAYIRSVSTMLMLIGICGVLISHTVLSKVSWAANLLSAVAITLLTLGVSSAITKFDLQQYVSPDKNFELCGIVNAFKNRGHLKDAMSGYEELIRKSRRLCFIGIKHNDLAAVIHDLAKLIALKSRDFRMDIYFLSPRSPHRFLFEPDVYNGTTNDLAHTMQANIDAILRVTSASPDVRDKVGLHVYDCVPIANIIAVDDRKYFINHYQYYQQSVESIWLEVTHDGYGQKVGEYVDHVRARSSRVLDPIAVLADDGSPIGLVKYRDEIHRAGDLHRSAHVWIVSPDGEVLLQKRAASVELAPGKWDISCTGHVRAGADSKSTAIREVREELGIALREDALELIMTTREKRVDGAFLDNELCDVFLAVADVRLSDCHIDPREVQAVKYVPFMSLSAFSRDPHIEFAEHPEEIPSVIKLLTERFPQAH